MALTETQSGGVRHQYDFDTVCNRRGTSCLKYDFGMKRAGRDDLLPMWVADMDFRLPDSILEVIKARVDHGIFGYTDPDDDYFNVLDSWFWKRYHWHVDRSWVTITPGVVYAVATAVRALTSPGDAVLIQEPVYYPFRETIEDNGRICVSSNLVNHNGYYEIDYEDFEKKLDSSNAKLFILCSPHNPVGRVWKPEELKHLADICRKYNVPVVADEIHCDFIYEGFTFTPFAALGEEYTDHAIICTSPSKSFNIAGLQVANIIIPNRTLRTAFRRVNGASGYSQANVLGLTAAKAVYELGSDWLDELLEYLNGNLSFFRNYLKDNIPGLKLTEPEGTYLLWVDFSHVVKSYSELKHLVQDEAHLWLDDGVIFGKESELYERFNIACPRSTLEQALSQLKQAVQNHQ